jgi:transposase-like protein
MTSAAAKLIKLRIRDHLGEMVRRTVEETLSAMLDAEADQLCGAGRNERSQARQDTPANSHDGRFAGEVSLKIPKLRRHGDHRTVSPAGELGRGSADRDVSGGLSVRRVKDITQAL